MVIFQFKRRMEPFGSILNYSHPRIWITFGSSSAMELPPLSHTQCTPHYAANRASWYLEVQHHYMMWSSRISREPAIKVPLATTTIILLTSPLTCALFLPSLSHPYHRQPYWQSNAYELMIQLAPDAMVNHDIKSRIRLYFLAVVLTVVLSIPWYQMCSISASDLVPSRDVRLLRCPNRY